MSTDGLVIVFCLVGLAVTYLAWVLRDLPEREELEDDDA